MRVDRKRKKELKIFAGIECERDRPVGLGATLGDGLKIENNFSSFRDFPGKADSVILLGFEYTINPENLIKIVGAIFEEMKIFFSCELPLILRVDRKQKYRLVIFAREPFQGIFREKLRMSHYWGSNVLQIHRI